MRKGQHPRALPLTHFLCPFYTVTLNPRPSTGRREGRHQQLKKANALRSLQQQAANPAQPYDWVSDPIWATPIPEPPDWDHLDDHQQHVYKLAAIAYAVRAISDTRGVSAADLLAAWNEQEAQ